MIGNRTFRLSLIPCGFTVLNLLFFGLLNLLKTTAATTQGGILILWLVLSALALFAIWGWVGFQSRGSLPNYGRALIFLNWPAFLCLAFALVYYPLVPLSGSLDGAPLLPYGMTAYLPGDVLAGLYSSSFMLGPVFPIYGWGNLGVLLVAVNTLIGFAVFSAGYFIRFVWSRFS